MLHFENMDMEATLGPVITSPRSLFICDREGIHPDTDLVLISMKAALVASNQNTVAAERRVAWWRGRRDRLLADLINQRQALIRSPPAATGSPARPTNITAVSSPNTVEKIKGIIAANEKKEQRQLAYIAEMRGAYEKYELKKIDDREKKDENERVAMAMVRKRDLDLRDSLLRKEQISEEEDIIIRAFQIERYLEIEEEDSIRQQRLEARRGEILQRKIARQKELRAKQELFSQQAKELFDSKVELGRKKLADEKARLDEQRLRADEEREERKREHTKRAERSRQKKLAADQLLEEKVTATLAKLEKDSEGMLRREELVSGERLESKVQHASKERERKRANESTATNDQARSESLAKRLADEEHRVSSWQDKLTSERTLKKQMNELAFEERLLHVERVRRQGEHEALMIRRQAEEKAKRIESLKEQQRQIAIERQNLRQEMDRVRANMSVSPTAKTPGPQDYNVIECERALLPNSSSIHIGASRRPKQSLDHAPGPGSYSLPPARNTRGAIMPPYSPFNK
eukprot:GILI01012099.1.p1 GENE.GILI01012099.1~~GILI01012099.1.p1  ORF type:complete len:521 (-),score=50.87 GILI01012099.1:62-1624(-)